MRYRSATVAEFHGLPWRLPGEGKNGRRSVVAISSAPGRGVKVGACRGGPRAGCFGAHLGGEEWIQVSSVTAFLRVL